MRVAVAGDAGGKGATIRGAVTVARSTGLTVLPHISLRTCARLNPGGRHTIQSSAGCLQAHVVQEASAWGRMFRGMNLILSLKTWTLVQQDFWQIHVTPTSSLGKLFILLVILTHTIKWLTSHLSTYLHKCKFLWSWWLSGWRAERLSRGRPVEVTIRTLSFHEGGRCTSVSVVLGK